MDSRVHEGRAFGVGTRFNSLQMPAPKEAPPQVRISSCPTVSTLPSIRISLLYRVSTDLAMELTGTLAINFGQQKSPFSTWSKGGFLLPHNLCVSAYLWIIGTFAGSSGAQMR
jgi:hypothetical protein